MREEKVIGVAIFFFISCYLQTKNEAKRKKAKPEHKD